MLKSVDIFQLNRPALTPTVVAKLKERGKQVRAYATVGGGKAENPASFYRAQAWEAFALGVSGFGFWAYADVGQSGTTLAAEGRQALGDSAKFAKIRRKLFELARLPGTGDPPK